MRTYHNQLSGTVSRARGLRRTATDAEKRLWRGLRDTFPLAKFRRQVPVGPYFADFFSFSARLIIEVDGGQHADAVPYDETRTAFLERNGYRVIRFWNNDVLTNLDGVLTMVGNALSPSPSQA
jgi:very-short-patch-repair endonuclease